MYHLRLLTAAFINSKCETSVIRLANTTRLSTSKLATHSQFHSKLIFTAPHVWSYGAVTVAAPNKRTPIPQSQKNLSSNSSSSE